MSTKGKVIGVGGVFFQCADPDATKNWYASVLGIEKNQYGGFDFLHSESAQQFPAGARTIFSPFNENEDYFAPSEKDVMFNLMVDDLEAVLARAATQGVEPIQPSEQFDYGHFAWILDPDGRKIELWQPIEPAD